MSAYVYLVRPGDQNDELRYSLRSLEANLPPGDVVIVGYCPTWVTGVLHIRGNRFGTHKQRNVYDNVLTAARCDALPDQVVWMNDDFITLAPAVPAMAHRCTLAEHIDGLTTRSWWWRSLKATDAWLRHQGHDDPLSFELHRPLPGDRRLMAEVLTRAASVQPANPPQWRTLYGNAAMAAGLDAGPREPDGKVYRADTPEPSGPWLSTTDASFRVVRDRVAALFPEPSRWER